MRSKEKIKKIRERALMREYVDLRVKTLIKEQGDDLSDYGAGGYGGRPGSTAFTLGIFGITGVMNVAKVAFGVGEAIITRVLGEAWLLARRLWYTINPIYFGMSSEELDAIIAEDRVALERRLDRVHAGYAATLEEARGVIDRMGGDINTVMFLANPAATVGYMATRGSVGAARNLYHRITVGGPPAAVASRESSLASRAAELEREHAALQNQMRQRGEDADNVMNNFARELLGPNATQQDLRNFITSNRTPASAPAAAAPGTIREAIKEQNVSPAASVPRITTLPTRAPVTMPSLRTIPAGNPPVPNIRPPSPASSTMYGSTGSTTERLNDLTRRTRELKNDYILFLNSDEIKNAILNQPVVAEGQKALTDILVQNYENTLTNITFEKMRDRNLDDFEKVERENPALFDTEEKRNAFVSYARQQLAAPVIAQLDTLARENPTLRNEVETAKRNVRSIAERGS